MDDETQKRLITILASGIAYGLASRLAGRLIEGLEVRGVRGDLKDAPSIAGFSLVSTLVAPYPVRPAVGSRWGA